MSLDALRLANFKAFGTPQRVPLRPITLLFGANSAGKSSVLHALALARHAVETGDLDVHRTRIGGDSIDLGGFRQYVHRGRPYQEVTLTFALDPAKFSGRLAEILGPAQSVEVEVGVGMEGTYPDGRVGVQRFAAGVDGRELLALSIRRGSGLQLDRADHAHPVFREVFRGILQFSTTAQDVQDEDFATLAEVVDQLVPQIAVWRSSGMFLRTEQVATEGTFRPIGRGHRQESLAQAARQLLPDVLRELLGGLSEVLEEEIRKLRYLGPLRSYPPRHLVFSQHHDPNWDAGGGWAWDEVRKRSDIRDRVNGWLGNPRRLKTPYKLRVRELLPAGALEGSLSSRLGPELYLLAHSLLREVESNGPHSDELAAALELLRQDTNPVSDVDSGSDESFLAIAELVDTIVDSEVVAEQWVREILRRVRERGDTRPELLLIDERSNTLVSHRDVGIGVSQVLPVLVSAYASAGELIAIEQPEIHLHPGLQAELGDVFLESALGDARNRFLIETHSEHLILRILRRIRETAEGDPPKEATPVRPEDVAVLYVQPGPEGAEIIELPITPDGEFERRWPDGFFAERAKELF